LGVPTIKKKKKERVALLQNSAGKDKICRKAGKSVKLPMGESKNNTSEGKRVLTRGKGEGEKSSRRWDSFRLGGVTFLLSLPEKKRLGEGKEKRTHFRTKLL